MEWRHKCSLDWLRERQHYLTASDIRALVPVTKTGRKRKVTKMDMLKVYASKRVQLTEADCWSYGAAARGHLLEPYAVDALNDSLFRGEKTNQKLFHWDDELVTLYGRKIAFSPDAMDIRQGTIGEPHRIAEVKCYSPERHIETAFQKADEIEERWQIATAMALLDSIWLAYLVLFNPSLYIDRLVVIPYSRNDLQDEIEMVRQVERDWKDFLRSMPLMPLDGRLASLDGLSESDIVEELERAQALNPV